MGLCSMLCGSPDVAYYNLLIYHLIFALMPYYFSYCIFNMCFTIWQYIYLFFVLFIQMKNIFTIYFLEQKL